MKVTREKKGFVVKVDQGDFPMVSLSPDVLGGDPSFVGTRVHVKTLFDYLMGGETVEDFLEGFPSVDREQVVNLLKVLARIATVGCYEEEDFS